MLSVSSLSVWINKLQCYQVFDNTPANRKVERVEAKCLKCLDSSAAVITCFKTNASHLQFMTWFNQSTFIYSQEIIKEWCSWNLQSTFGKCFFLTSTRGVCFLSVCQFVGRFTQKLPNRFPGNSDGGRVSTQNRTPLTFGSFLNKLVHVSGILI